MTIKGHGGMHQGAIIGPHRRKWEEAEAKGTKRDKKGQKGTKRDKKGKKGIGTVGQIKYFECQI